MLAASGLSCWDVSQPLIDLMRRRTNLFWHVFDLLSSEQAFTAGEVNKSLAFNMSNATMESLVHNLTDAHDKKRFLPIPFDPRLFVLVDCMLFGKLPVCPACGGSSLLGSPSGWVSCRGWSDKKGDRPCVWHSKKDGPPFERHHGLWDPIEWEMPMDVKPTDLRGQGWKNILLPVDSAELRSF